MWLGTKSPQSFRSIGVGGRCGLTQAQWIRARQRHRGEREKQLSVLHFIVIHRTELDLPLVVGCDCAYPHICAQFFLLKLDITMRLHIAIKLHIATESWPGWLAHKDQSKMHTDWHHSTQLHSEATINSCALGWQWHKDRTFSLLENMSQRFDKYHVCWLAGWHRDRDNTSWCRTHRASHS